MKYMIELTSANEIQEFTKIVQGVDVDVRLEGKDENGNHW